MCYFRWRKSTSGDRRRGPNRVYNKLSEAERQRIIEISCLPEFRDKHPKQIVPLLADRGIYVASETTFYRVLRENKLLAHRSSVSPPRHSKPKELTAVGPNQVWSWDITYLKSSVLGIFYYLYIVIDIYSRKIVAWRVAPYESAEISSAMIKRACFNEKVKKKQLFIHSDNGGPMKAGTMLATLRRLGVLPSFSRPSVSDDNAFSEALFKTLKYRPFYPRKPFENVKQAELWVEDFVKWYNTEHLHSAIGFVTPECRHKGQDEAILEKRKQVYQEAFQKNPNRWIGKTPRGWDSVSYVTLNPIKKLADKKAA